MHIHTRHYGSNFLVIEKSMPEPPHFFLRHFQSNKAYVYYTISSLILHQSPPCWLRPISKRRCFLVWKCSPLYITAYPWTARLHSPCIADGKNCRCEDCFHEERRIDSRIKWRWWWAIRKPPATRKFLIFIRRGNHVALNKVVWSHRVKIIVVKCVMVTKHVNIRLIPMINH